ncbi:MULTISPECIES: hypothetical protein [Brucella/Ochrobactrum group]|uniref:hypothetical protein n=1 Tax=Brucella/Ochrobactrum group TaxID=2826938 RepID=UPI001E6093E8|nr:MULTISPECIES: hypothetical protein [Brucella/Ochrobactrum group]UGQ23255.1 hypothetical protein LRL11_22445 [Brucella anthropi]
MSGRRDPLPTLRKEAEDLRLQMEKAKRQKKAFKDIERAFIRKNAETIAVERGISYRNGSLDWGR